MSRFGMLSLSLFLRMLIVEDTFLTTPMTSEITSDKINNGRGKG